MKAIFTLMIFSSLAFSNISIFISSKNKTMKIDEKELANLYLKKTDTLNGIKITPIDSKDQKLYREFYKKIVKKSPSQLQAYWTRQIFKGDRQPPQRLTKREIKHMSKKRRAIITYTKNPLNGKIVLTIK